jgi:hypothetical protein
MKIKKLADLQDILINNLTKLDNKHKLVFVFPTLISDSIAKKSDIEGVLRKFYAKSILKELFISGLTDNVNSILSAIEKFDDMENTALEKYIELLKQNIANMPELKIGQSVGFQTISLFLTGAYKIPKMEKSELQKELKTIKEKLEQIVKSDPYYKEYEVEVGFFVKNGILVPVLVGTKKFQAPDTGIALFLLTAYIFNIPIDDISSIRKIKDIISRGFIAEFVYRLNQGENIHDLIEDLKTKYSDINYNFIPKVKVLVKSSKIEKYLNLISSQVETAAKNFELILSDFIHSGLKMLPEQNSNAPEPNRVTEEFINILVNSALSKNNDLWGIGVDFSKDKNLKSVLFGVNKEIAEYINRFILTKPVDKVGREYIEKFYLPLSIFFDSLCTTIDRFAASILIELSDPNYIITVVSDFVIKLIKSYFEQKLKATDAKSYLPNRKDKSDERYFKFAGINLHDIKDIFSYVLSVIGLSLSQNPQSQITRELIKSLSEYYSKYLRMYLDQLNIDNLVDPEFKKELKIISTDIIEEIPKFIQNGLFGKVVISKLAKGYYEKPGALFLPIRSFDVSYIEYLVKTLHPILVHDKNLEQILNYATKTVVANLSPKIIEFGSEKVKSLILENKNLIKTIQYYVRELILKEFQTITKVHFNFGAAPLNAKNMLSPMEVEKFATEISHEVLSIYAYTTALLIAYIKMVAILFCYFRNILVIYTYKMTNDLDSILEYYKELNEIKKLFERAKLNYALIINEKIIEYITGLINPVLLSKLIKCIEERDIDPNNLSSECKKLLDIYDNPEDISELPPDKSPDISHKNMKYILSHLTMILKFCSIITYNDENDTVLYKMPYMKKPLKTKLQSVIEFVNAPLFEM